MTTSKDFVFIGPYQNGWWVLERINRHEFLQVFPPYLLHLLHFMPLHQAFSHCRLQAAGTISQLPIDRPWPEEIQIDDVLIMSRKEFLQALRGHTKNLEGFLKSLVRNTG